MQLPPVDGIKVFKPLFGDSLFRFLRATPQTSDQRFFRVLNKIRFGIVMRSQGNPHRALATVRPSASVWNTTYLCSLRKEAEAIEPHCTFGMPGARLLRIMPSTLRMERD